MSIQQQLNEAKTEAKRLIGNALSKTITGEEAADQIEGIYIELINSIRYPGEPGRLKAERSIHDDNLREHFKDAHNDTTGR